MVFLLPSLRIPTLLWVPLGCSCWKSLVATDWICRRAIYLTLDRKLKQRHSVLLLTKERHASLFEGRQ
jgi:hypothetical protein